MITPDDRTLQLIKLERGQLRVELKQALLHGDRETAVAASRMRDDLARYRVALNGAASILKKPR